MIRIDFIENINERDEYFQKQLDYLLEAISNWDEKLIFLDDYLKSVKRFLNDSLERNRFDILNILERKNAVKTAWKMESITILLNLLGDNEELLVDVLENIKVRIMKYYLNSSDLQSERE